MRCTGKKERKRDEIDRYKCRLTRRERERGLDDKWGSYFGGACLFVVSIVIVACLFGGCCC